MKSFKNNYFNKDISLLNKKKKGNLKSFNTLLLLFKIWPKIKKKRKFQFYVLIFLMIISGFLEVLALGSLLPFLEAISNSDDLLRYKFINFLSQLLGYTSQNQLIFLTTIIFISMVFISGIVRVTTLFINFRLTALIGAELSTEGFRRALYQPYKKHLQWNSSFIINTLSKDIEASVKGLSHLLIIINSLVLGVSILIGIFLVDYKIALSLISIFGIAYIFIGYSNRKQIERNSYEITKKSQHKIKVLQEALGAIKDILLGSNQNFYTDNFSKTDYKIRKLSSKNSYLASSPKYLIETLGITFIAIIGSSISSQGFSSGAISLIGLIALGSQRLLPSIQSFYSSWVNLKGSTSQIVNVLSLISLNIKEEIIFQNFKFKECIEFKNISFRYGESKPWIINKVNFKINKGEKIGIIGETGSGKSTVIDLLMTLIEPSLGKLFIDGEDIYGSKSRKFLDSWKTQITHIPQLIYLADSNFLENIAFGEQKEDINIKRVKEAAEKAQISKFIESCPDGYFTRVGERGVRLSGGQRQRISLARAFYRDKKIFILDEATSALDVKTENSVIQSIYNLGPETTLIMVAHRVSTLKGCDRVLNFSNGRLIENGIPKNVLKEF